MIGHCDHCIENAHLAHESADELTRLRAENASLSKKLDLMMNGRSEWTRNALDELDRLRAEVEELRKTKTNLLEVNFDCKYCGDEGTITVFRGNFDEDICPFCKGTKKLTKEEFESFHEGGTRLLMELLGRICNDIDDGEIQIKEFKDVLERLGFVRLKPGEVRAMWVNQIKPNLPPVLVEVKG